MSRPQAVSCSSQPGPEVKQRLNRHQYGDPIERLTELLKHGYILAVYNLSYSLEMTMCYRNAAFKYTVWSQQTSPIRRRPNCGAVLLKLSVSHKKDTTCNFVTGGMGATAIHGNAECACYRSKLKNWICKAEVQVMISTIGLMLSHTMFYFWYIAASDACNLNFHSSPGVVDNNWITVALFRNVCRAINMANRDSHKGIQPSRSVMCFYFSQCVPNRLAAVGDGRSDHIFWQTTHHRLYHSHCLGDNT